MMTRRSAFKTAAALALAAQQPGLLKAFEAPSTKGADVARDSKNDITFADMFVNIFRLNPFIVDGFLELMPEKSVWEKIEFEDLKPGYVFKQGLEGKLAKCYSYPRITSPVGSIEVVVEYLPLTPISPT